MKITYEAPQFSMSECRVQDDFLTSGISPIAPIQYESTEGWSSIRPPKH